MTDGVTILSAGFAVVATSVFVQAGQTGASGTIRTTYTGVFPCGELSYCASLPTLSPSILDGHSNAITTTESSENDHDTTDCNPKQSFRIFELTSQTFSH